MEQIPTESRTVLESLLRVVGGPKTRLTTDKDARTLRSRQDHFLRFLSDMHLGTNVSLKEFTQVIRNVIMVCYVAHLASGQTLLCRSIKTCTIRKYLKAASDLSIPFQMMNPTVDIQAKESEFIKDILYDAHYCESMPKCREHITKDMVSFIRTKGSFLSLQDNIYIVLSDWLPWVSKQDSGESSGPKIKLIFSCITMSNTMWTALLLLSSLQTLPSVTLTVFISPTIQFQRLKTSQLF